MGAEGEYIRVKALNAAGKPFTIEAEELLRPVGYIRNSQKMEYRGRCTSNDDTEPAALVGSFPPEVAGPRALPCDVFPVPAPHPLPG